MEKQGDFKVIGLRAATVFHLKWPTIIKNRRSLPQLGKWRQFAGPAFLADLLKAGYPWYYLALPSEWLWPVCQLL